MNCPRCSVAVPGPGSCPWCGYPIEAAPAPTTEPADVPGASGPAPGQPPAGWQQPPPGWQPQPPPGWQPQPPPGEGPPPGWQYGAPGGAWQYAPPPTWKGAADGFPWGGPGALASPWRRLAARVIDYLIFLPVFIVLLAPVISDIVDDFDRIADLPSDQQSREIEQTVNDAFDDRVLIAIAALGVSVFVYEVAMLAWRGATLGKLAVGIRVIPLRERARTSLSLGTATLRTGLPSLVGLIPYIGPLGQAIDALWCLWDPRRQCLHDKVASTVVVRSR